MNGKGSRQRPCLVSRQEFENNWDNIFGKKDVTSEGQKQAKAFLKDEYYDIWEESTRD